MEILGLLNAEHDEPLPFREMLLGLQREQNEECTMDALINKLRIKNSKVREAMTLIPRDQFALKLSRWDTLVDRPIMTLGGYNISAPHMHAMLLESLDLQPGQRVLDIGSGSGLLTAYIAYMIGKEGRAVGVDVLLEATCDAERNVEQQIRQNAAFKSQAARCEFHTGSIFLPGPCSCMDAIHAPGVYDRIVCGAACPESKRFLLLRMLRPGGILLSPMLGGGLERTTKHPDATTVTETVSLVRFKDMEVPSDWEIVRAAILDEEEKRRASDAAAPWLKVEHPSAGSAGCPSSETASADHKRTRLEHVSSQQASKEHHNLKDDDYDCTLLGHNWALPAHRSVLRLRCELFRAQCVSGMRDSEACEIRVLQDFSQGAVEDFLWYCYSNTLNPSTSEDPDAVMNCLEVAIYCGAPNLVHFCELDLDAKLTDFSVSKAATDELAPRILSMAIEYSLPFLQNSAVNYITKFLGSVAKTRSYQDLPKEHVHFVTSHACQRLSLVNRLMESLHRGALMPDLYGET